MSTIVFLDIASSIVPDRAAIVFEGAKITYAELEARVNKLAGSMSGLGIGEGDKVAMMNVNGPGSIEAYFATARLGAVYAPLDFHAKPDELEFLLGNTQPVLVLAGDRYVDAINSIRGRLRGIRACINIGGLGKDGWLPYESLLQGASTAELQELQCADVPDEATTVILHTSGTTSRPKGVLLTHSTFSSYVLGNVEPADAEREEPTILSVPLYHVAGMQTMMAAIYGGRTLVMQRQFNAEEWMQLAQEYKAKRAMLVPKMLSTIMESPEFEEYDLSSLKVITCGGSQLTLPHIKDAWEKFPGARIINAYGQTEAGIIAALSPEDYDIPRELSGAELERRLERLTSIGRPLPGVTVRIVNPDNGQDVKKGDIGELVVSCQQLMKGYLGTRESPVKDGWLHTGDTAYIKDGCIYLAGRIRDIIIHGGENISPEAVENHLLSHQSVLDVAVIGLPDPNGEETVMAVVVPKPGSALSQEELIAYCGTMSAAMRPQRIEFAEALPRNPLGKVLKADLRATYTLSTT